MKYAKHIVFFLFINLIIVFLTIFLGNLTRKLEVNNNLTKQYILEEKELLKVNKIEFSFYNNSSYLKKLHEIYFSYEEENLENKIVNLSSLSNLKNHNIILINTKSK